MKVPANALIEMADRDSARLRSQHAGKLRWEMVHSSEGPEVGVKLTRSDRPDFLYRGQTRHYDSCRPSICRGFAACEIRASDLEPLDQARLLRGIALNSWFGAELKRHPMLSWADAQRIHIDVVALGQHYGIPTGYIDVSESFEVTAFFATCQFDASSSSWEPVDEGVGVIYRVPTEALGERARPICYQPFPRPSVQWAWTIELLLHEDFLQAPLLQILRFDHDASVGQEFLRRTDRGRTILPPDPTARLAASMCASSEIPAEHLAWAEDDLANDPNGLRKRDLAGVRELLVSKLGTGPSESTTVAFTDTELREAQSLWARHESDFYRGVGFRFVRTRRTADEV